MKTLIALLTITLLFGCDDSKNTSGVSKGSTLELPACTEYEFNDCTNIQREEGDTSISKVTVPVSISSRANRRGFRRVEILANSRTQDLGLRTIPCNIDIYAGKILNIRSETNAITIRSSSGSQRFNKLSRKRSGRKPIELSGRWGNTTLKDGMKIMTVIDLQRRGEITIQKKCILLR